MANLFASRFIDDKQIPKHDRCGSQSLIDLPRSNQTNQPVITFDRSSEGVRGQKFDRHNANG